MANREAFGVDEWYHCYSRGVDKRKTFETLAEYRRFLQLLYLCNSSTTIHRSDLFKKSHAEILQVERGEPLVALGAYSLMPNHFHLLLKEIVEGGIAAFMQKLGIAYAMYFNRRHERTGNLFVKPFRSKHVADDRYFRYVAQYLHLNPAELFEPNWKEGNISNLSHLEKSLFAYPFSSLADYCGADRPEKVLLDQQSFNLMRELLPPLSETIGDAAAYYADLAP